MSAQQGWEQLRHAVDFVENNELILVLIVKLGPVLPGFEVEINRVRALSHGVGLRGVADLAGTNQCYHRSLSGKHFPGRRVRLDERPSLYIIHVMDNIQSCAWGPMKTGSCPARSATLFQ